MTDKIIDEERDLPIDQVFTETTGIQEGQVTAIHMLNFAKGILIGLAIIFIGAAISEFFKPNNAIYEACKVTVPSLATLVIGYYFGASK